MATIGEIISEFITEHELDEEIWEPMTQLFSKCMEAHALFILKEKIPTFAPKEKKESNKASKEDKIEDPSTVETRDELRNCNTTVLNEYCKTNGLKVGGNKPQIMDRVWRHIQGESSDEDKSPKSKPKKEKVVPVKHTCFGKNAKGAPCSISGTEEVDGCWFCFRHIKDAAEIIAKSVEPEPEKKPKAAKKSKETEPKKKAVKEIVEEVEEDEEEDEMTEEQKAAAARKAEREAARAAKKAAKAQLEEDA
jgi:hypothetical protein